jgi:ribonucleotide monophosphatase NagD (HAD superfamily)
VTHNIKNKKMNKFRVEFLNNKKGEKGKDLRKRIEKAIKEKSIDAVLMSGDPARLYCRDQNKNIFEFFLKKEGKFQVIPDQGNFVVGGEIMAALSVWGSRKEIERFLQNGKDRWM